MEPPEQAPVAPQESEAFAAVARRLADNVARAVQVRRETLEHVLVALLAEGHVLVEDYPGRRQDRAGAGAGALDRLSVRARAVHVGPAARRRRRDERL